MRFSLYLNAQSPGPAHDLPVIEAITAQALRADAEGFAGICLTEHHFTGYNTYGNPFTFGAYLAPQLAQAHIVLSVAVPALWHPMNLAEACNTLDLLTRGRCVIGFGTGGSPQEYKGLGRDPEQRGPLMEEVITVAEQARRKTLDDPDLPYSTTHAEGVLTRRIMPTSFTPAGPRFGRATLSDEGIVYTAERGWVLMTARADVDEIGRRWKLYHGALDAAGHDTATVNFARRWSMVQKMVYVGADDESALRDIEGPLDYLAEQSRSTFGSGDAKAAGFKNSVVGVSATNREEFIRTAMIVGSPRTVAEEIATYRNVGVEHLTLVFLFGQMDPALADASLDRFIADVKPNFDDNGKAAE